MGDISSSFYRLPPATAQATLKAHAVIFVMVLKAFLVGLVLALVLTPITRFFALRFGVIDVPGGERKTHARPTALLGGVAVFLAFALAVFFLREDLLGGFLLPKHVLGIALGGAILVAGGALDDRFQLRPALQIIFPILATLTVIASGVGADVITNPLGGVLRLDQWHVTLLHWGDVPYRLTLPADLFTFMWLMGMTYTTKLLDGLDGLVSGLGLIGFTVLALLSLTPEMGQPELARLAMIAAGVLGGFLFFNARPASIFLGEGGSTLVGFLLGVMAVLSGGKIGITLLALAVPIMDVAWTIVRRLRNGKQIAQGGVDHLHFQLVRRGVSPNQTVALFWLFAAAFGGVGLFIRGREKLLALMILAILFACVTFMLGRRAHERNPR